VAKDSCCCDHRLERKVEIARGVTQMMRTETSCSAANPGSQCKCPSEITTPSWQPGRIGRCATGRCRPVPAHRAIEVGGAAENAVGAAGRRVQLRRPLNRSNSRPVAYSSLSELGFPMAYAASSRSTSWKLPVGLLHSSRPSAATPPRALALWPGEEQILVMGFQVGRRGEAHVGFWARSCGPIASSSDVSRLPPNLLPAPGIEASERRSGT